MMVKKETITVFVVELTSEQAKLIVSGITNLDNSGRLKEGDLWGDEAQALTDLRISLLNSGAVNNGD